MKLLKKLASWLNPKNWFKKTITPNYTIVVLWWQSNSVCRALGQGIPINPYVHVLSPGGMLNHPYNIQQKNDIIPAQEPLPNPSPGIHANNISWVIKFCEGLGASERNQFIIVPAARGNTGFSDQNPPISNWKVDRVRYNYMMERTAEAMKIQNVRGEPIFVAIGGENDSEGEFYNENFIQDLDTLIEFVRETYPQSTFVIGPPADDFIEKNRNAAEIVDIIKDTPNRHFYVGIAELEGLHTFDQVHYDYDANRYSIPIRMIEAYKRAKRNRP